MNGLAIQRYECDIRDSRVAPVSLDGKPAAAFRFPATAGNIEKLYAVKHEDAFCYIGIASRSLSARLRDGMKPSHKHGYHGYAWRHLPHVSICVWPTDEFDRDTIEAVEAELVYTIRRETGKWPTHQTEIHFHNLDDGVSDRVRKMAEALYNALK